MNLLVHVTDARGITRLEIAATLAALGLLLVLTAGMTRAEPAKTAACFNNLRQLGRAALAYADDNDDKLPPRSPMSYWPGRLRPYYKELALLVCPSDAPYPHSGSGGFGTNTADAAPRSYILHGWRDYWSTHYGGFGPASTNGFPMSAIREPARTILFGEKASPSLHYWFDLAFGDDVFELEMGRHYRAAADSASGASNHALADGSVQLLK